MSADTADVVIVGAGAYGLSCAWWIARRHSGARVVVLEQGDFAHGATGRNGAGLRAQWGLESNVRLCQESIAFFAEAAERLEYPRGIDFKQDGCLLVARSDESHARVSDGVSLQRDLDLASELLSPEECLRLAPAIQPEGLRGGAYCAEDGSASPFLWLDALQRAARHEGAKVRHRVRVERIERRSSDFVVHADAGPVTAGKVLLCSDWAVPDLLAPLGVELPVTAVAREALVTEACPPLIGPVLVDMDQRLSVNQMRRGTVVFVVSRERDGGADLVPRADFLRHASRAILDLLPGIGDLRALRTWGGVSSATPDMQAILGETEIEGLYVAVSAYRGFMTSPAAGRLMAELVVDGRSDDPILGAVNPRRFDGGTLTVEPLVDA